MNRKKIIIILAIIIGLCLFSAIFLVFPRSGPPISLTPIAHVTFSPPSTDTPPPPTRETIAKINLVDTVQDDGSIQTEAKLSIAPLSVGVFDIVASKIMTVSNPSLVTLKIDPGTGLSELSQTPLDETNIPGNPDHLLNVTDEISIFPVMTAELSGSINDFLIEDMDQATKPIISGQETIWRWQVTPKQDGNKLLLMQISIPVEIEGEILENAQMLAQRDLSILVNQEPTPIPTATPTNMERIESDFINNPVAVFGTILTFVIGLLTVLIAYLTYRHNKNKPEPATPSTLDTSQQVRLHQILDNDYNDQELRDLCFELGVDYEDLPFPGQSNKARELVALMNRKGQLDKLETVIRRDRPASFNQGKSKNKTSNQEDDNSHGEFDD